MAHADRFGSAWFAKPCSRHTITCGSLILPLLSVLPCPVLSCLVLSCLVLSLCVSAQLRVAAVGLVKEMLKDRDPSTAGTRRQPASQPASQSLSLRSFIIWNFFHVFCACFGRSCATDIVAPLDTQRLCLHMTSKHFKRKFQTIKSSSRN
jgi:hypothetical protein